MNAPCANAKVPNNNISMYKEIRPIIKKKKMMIPVDDSIGRKF